MMITHLVRCLDISSYAEKISAGERGTNGSSGVSGSLYNFIDRARVIFGVRYLNSACLWNA